VLGARGYRTLSSARKATRLHLVDSLRTDGRGTRLDGEWARIVGEPRWPGTISAGGWTTCTGERESANACPVVGSGSDHGSSPDRRRAPESVEKDETVSATIACVTVVVRDYDEAIEYFTRTLGFELQEDSPRGDGKRWVVVAPAGATGTGILLARAATPSQERSVGNQTGGRVGFFLHTDDFVRTYETMRDRGARFVEEPRHEPYGTVAVFEDLYGNRWDLLEPRP
jgi:catechol 2,3-dioxygenase-like lactoylglutathione lyase family enzyme